MSKASDAFDAILARVVAILPSHKQMANPYDPASNPRLTLNQGFGIQILAGTNTNLQISCNLTIQRIYGLVLARRRLGSDLKASKNESAEKLLMEDQFLIVKDFEKDPTLNNSDVVISTLFTTDSGITNWQADNQAYAVLTTLFELQYFEDITS